MTGVHWAAVLHPLRATQAARLFDAVRYRRSIAPLIAKKAEIQRRRSEAQMRSAEGLARAMPAWPVQWQLYNGRNL